MATSAAQVLTGPETPAAAEAPATPAPVAPAPAKTNERMYTVKVNGKEEQWPESKVLERAQKAEGAEAAMKEAHVLRTAFANFVKQAQDPKQLLALLQSPDVKYDEVKQEALVSAILESKNPRLVQAVKEWLYRNEVEPATLTAEQRAIREKDAAIARYQAEEQARKDADAANKFKQDTERFFADYKAKISQAIAAEKLPLTEDTVRLIGNCVKWQRRNNQPANFAQAAQWVKQYLQKTADERFSKASDEELLSLLPAGTAERINRVLVARLKGDGGKTPGPAKAKGKDKYNLRDALRKIEKGQQAF